MFKHQLGAYPWLSVYMYMYEYVLNILLTESIVMLYNAGPLDVSWAINSNKVVAILESFFPAQVSLN